MAKKPTKSSNQKQSQRSTEKRDGINPKMLELLVCPLTQTRLEYDSDNQELISQKAKLAYPIRDGVPIMLPSEARQLES